MCCSTVDKNDGVIAVISGRQAYQRLLKSLLELRKQTVIKTLSHRLPSQNGRLPTGSHP